MRKLKFLYTINYPFFTSHLFLSKYLPIIIPKIIKIGIEIIILSNENLIPKNPISKASIGILAIDAELK